jgi:hypothetical protein
VAGYIFRQKIGCANKGRPCCRIERTETLRFPKPSCLNQPNKIVPSYPKTPLEVAQALRTFLVNGIRAKNSKSPTTLSSSADNANMRLREVSIVLAGVISPITPIGRVPSIERLVDVG